MQSESTYCLKSINKRPNAFLIRQSVINIIGIYATTNVAGLCPAILLGSIWIRDTIYTTTKSKFLTQHFASRSGLCSARIPRLILPKGRKSYAGSMQVHAVYRAVIWGVGLGTYGTQNRTTQLLSSDKFSNGHSVKTVLNAVHCVS